MGEVHMVATIGTWLIAIIGPTVSGLEAGIADLASDLAVRAMGAVGKVLVIGPGAFTVLFRSDRRT
ncbi:MAG TPA: hypothetical protein VK137_03190, partial [Planctomycetaceae bacterium]|nr:hypothetical protein [Planctomycetaceae bacterium]